MPVYATGDTVANRYTLIRQLGRGGMGTVWLAKDIQRLRLVALKHVNVAAPSMLARFRREISAMQRVQHPNVVELYDVCQVQDEHWIVMRYYEGAQTLQAFIGRMRTPPTQAEICWVGKGAAAGLHAIHQQGLVHRDVKPSNILILPDGGVVIIDLGIVKAIDATALTHTRGFIGTPAYASPEQLEEHGVGFATDVYSLGISLIHLAQRRYPFGDGYSMGALIRVILRGTYRFTRTDLSDIAHLLRRMANVRAPQRPSMEAALRQFNSVVSHWSPVTGETLPTELLATRFATAFPEFESSLQQTRLYADTLPLLESSTPNRAVLHL